MPLICGFIFGPEFVGGLLIGTTLSSIMLALYTANAGGAWDNGKKYIENGHHGGKGSEAHKAAVVGDTVGDPLKDTVGPSLDILIKIMSVVSLIFVSIFGKYNLFGLFKPFCCYQAYGRGSAVFGPALFAIRMMKFQFPHEDIAYIMMIESISFASPSRGGAYG